MADRRTAVVATYSIVACDLDAGQRGGRPVEVPGGRLGRPVGGAAHRRRRDAVLREPALRPDGLALLREGLDAAEAAERLTAATTGARRGSSASSTARAAARPSPARNVWSGPAAAWASATPHRGTSSSRRRPSTRSPRRSSRRPARRSPRASSGCLAAAQLAGGDRRGQQSASLLVVERNGGYAGLGHGRRPPRRRPCPSGRGARAALRHPPAALRQDAAEEWLEVDDGLREELLGRLGGLGYDGEVAEALFARGRAQRISRNGSRAQNGSIRSFWRS